MVPVRKDLFTTQGLKSFIAFRKTSSLKENPGRHRLPGVLLLRLRVVSEAGIIQLCAYPAAISLFPKN